MIASNMTVYHLKLMFLNQVIAPITMLLLLLTLCVQGSATKLFKAISSYSNQFVLKLVQGFFTFILTNYNAILSLSFLANIFAAQSFEWEESPTELVLHMWYLEPLELSTWWNIRFDWEIVMVATASCYSMTVVGKKVLNSRYVLASKVHFFSSNWTIITTIDKSN